MYEIKAAAKNEAGKTSAEILIFGDIGESWFGESVTAKDFVEALGKLEADEITVRINSFGGSVVDGIAIYNALARHAARVTTVNEGSAMSVASLILMAGNEVHIHENALTMIHAPWGRAAGNSKELRQYADLLDKWAAAMASAYARNGKSKEEILSLLLDGEDHFYTAADALISGFCDRVLTRPVTDESILTQASARYARPLARRAPIFASYRKETLMPDPTPAAPAETTNPATESSILAADKTRRDAIRQTFARAPKGHDLSALARECEDDPRCTAEAAAARILEKISEGAAPVSGIHIVEDEADKRKAAAVAALIARAGLADKETRAAARTIEATVYAALVSNGGLGPILADGKTIFHTDHGNIGAGKALSTDALDADAVLMSQQTDVTGNEYLALNPALLLVPIGLRGDAIVIVEAEFDTSRTGNSRVPNKVRNIVKDIVGTPRLAGTRRYLFADPGIAPVMEVSFLDGQQEPYLERQEGFDVDGSRFKVRQDFGVSGIDYRGAVTNAGA